VETVVVSSRWALQVDAHGNPRTVLGINSDITSRKHAEAALEHQALHDALTGLPNRSLFRDRLEHALAQAGRREQLVAVRAGGAAARARLRSGPGLSLRPTSVGRSHHRAPLQGRGPQGIGRLITSLG
jgi:hypothetical protein